MMTMTTGEGKDDAPSGDGADAEAGARAVDGSSSTDASGNVEPGGDTDLGTLPTETDHAEIIDDSGQGNQPSGDTANLTEPADDASADASAGALEEGKAEDERKDEHEDVSDSDGNPVPTSGVAIPEVEAQADEASEVVVQQHDDQPSTLEEGNNTQQQQAAAAAAAIDDPQQTAEEGANINNTAQTATAAAPEPASRSSANTPWYKKHLILALLFVIVALAAAIVGIVISQNNSNNGGVVDGSKSNKAPQQPTDLAPSSSDIKPTPSPSDTPVLLGIPSPTVPTIQQSNPPSSTVALSPESHINPVPTQHPSTANIPERVNVVAIFRDVPRRDMTLREIEKYLEIMTGYLQKHTEFQMVLEGIDLWHHKIVAVEAEEEDNQQITAVEITMVLRISNNTLPSNLLGNLISVTIEENEAELLSLLNEQGGFYTYFKNIDGVNSYAIEYVTNLPTPSPTTLQDYLDNGQASTVNIEVNPFPTFFPTVPTTQQSNPLSSTEALSPETPAPVASDNTNQPTSSCSIACQNGGKCVLAQENEYGTEDMCDCTDAIVDGNPHAGLTCEYPATISCMTLGGESKHSFCTNGGECAGIVTDNAQHLGCFCNVGFEGSYCEYVLDTGPGGNNPTTQPTASSSSVTTTNKPSSSIPISTPGSPAQSAAPTSTRFLEVVKKLTPLSREEAFNDSSSPQYKAAMWMADQDPIPNFASGGTGLDLDDPRFEQRYILVLFFFAMDGVNWENNQGWLTGQDECYWYGIGGKSDGCGHDGVGGCIKGNSIFDSDYNKVCRIGMGRLNNLYGEIPSEMGQLTEMRWFEIQDDFLIGTIPDALGTGWEKVHTFLVGGNYLHGGFPDTFEGNEMLGTIFIDRNQFNDTFPSVFATLKNLKWLDAEDNDFVGQLPDDIGDLKSLRVLNVNNNSLTHALPDTWDDMNLIEDLEVAYNHFTGPLPPSLGKARFLKDLRASGNQLTGSIPASYYNLENLEELYLDENNLVGELPQTDEPFYDGLQEFSIHSNGFTGQFPVERFEDTFRVKVMSLHNNQLTGGISSNICERWDPSLAYTQLTKLTVDCDLIVCTCCTCYENGELVSTFTPISNIGTTATIPASVEATTSVSNKEDLNQGVSRPTRAPNSPPLDRSGIQEQIENNILQRNAVFEGMDINDPRYLALDWILNKDKMLLATDDVNLFQRYIFALVAFSLDSLAWYYCGEHRSFGTATEMFVVEDCEVPIPGTGQIGEFKVWLSSTDECDWYGVICSSNGVARGLELMGNDLIGEIPPEISQLNFLQLLALSGNCLYGTIPYEMGTMQNLLSLELHGNGLHGQLPTELYNLSQLERLNVAMQYQYSYQCQRSNGRYVNTLFLMGDPTGGYNYGLEGHIMGPGIGQMTNLKGLHVFDNSFSGWIDESIGDLENLVVLRAQNNILSSWLPNSFTDLKNVREVYLGTNGLINNIPPNIGNMEALEDLRLNENPMVGAIPDSLYELRKLKYLWLQDTLNCNNLDQQGGSCVVDSEVGFSGTISTMIGNLENLSHLLIDNNPIGGTLPTEVGLCEDLSIIHIHKTNIEGVVPDEVCLLRDKNLNNELGVGVFYADCGPNNSTQDPFIECSCCSDCCDHTTQVCIADD